LNSYLTTEISHPKEVFVSALYYRRFAIDSDCRLEQQFMNTLGSFCALDDYYLLPLGAAKSMNKHSRVHEDRLE
jgi:hypothetical protein